MNLLKNDINKFKEFISDNYYIDEYLAKLIDHIKINFKNKKCVLNITGEFESLVAFKLFESVLGRENIYPVYIPYGDITKVSEYYIDKFHFNSKENLEEAKEWAKKFGYIIAHSKDKEFDYAGDFYLAKCLGKETHNTLMIPDDCMLIISPLSIINPLSFRLDTDINLYEGKDAPFRLISVDPLIYNDIVNNDFYTNYIGKKNVLRFSLNSRSKHRLFFENNIYLNGDYDFDRIFESDDRNYCEEISKNTIDFIDVYPVNFSTELLSNFSLDKESDIKFLKRMKANILQYVADSIKGVLINPKSLTKKVLNIGQFELDEDFMPFVNLTSHEVFLIGLALNIPENYLFSNFNLDDINIYEDSLIDKDILKLDLKIKSFLSLESPLVNLPKGVFNQLKLAVLEE